MEEVCGAYKVAFSDQCGDKSFLKYFRSSGPSFSCREPAAPTLAHTLLPHFLTLKPLTLLGKMKIGSLKCKV